MWLWIISNIAGALLGAATVSWFGKTKAGKSRIKILDAETDISPGVRGTDSEDIPGN